MSQHTPFHGKACHCRCCNGHYREFRVWIAGIQNETERLSAQAELEAAFLCEYERNIVLRPIPQPQQLKRHMQPAEVPDSHVETSF